MDPEGTTSKDVLVDLLAATQSHFARYVHGLNTKARVSFGIAHRTQYILIKE